MKLDNSEGTLPYNFVMTKDWMFMVLRRAPEYQKV